MAEKSFDALLRQALLDANWREWQPLWEGAEEPEFSSDYRRWRLRLLSDPFGWVKKRLRPLWARVLRTAACLLLASAVALGSLMAVSPTVRAAVLSWLRSFGTGWVDYIGTEETQEHDSPPAWRPTCLPEGFSLNNLTADEDNSSCTWSYRDGQGRTLSLKCFWPQEMQTGVAYGMDVDIEDLLTQVTIWGRPADLYQHGESITIIWQSEDGLLFRLSGRRMEVSDLEQVAESVAEIDAQPIAPYHLTWVPEGCSLYRQEGLMDVVKETWITEENNFIDLFCVSASAGDITAPDGTPEEVSVGDLTGLYWAPRSDGESQPETTITIGGAKTETAETEQKPETTITFGGTKVSDPAPETTITFGSSKDDTGSPTAEQEPETAVTFGGGDDESVTYYGYAVEDESTLIWTDPETGTTFRLQGLVDRETILHMAESMTQR